MNSPAPTTSPAAQAEQAERKVLLQTRGLGRSFQSGSRELHVLRDIDLTVREGEMFAVVGRSGAGKSTLLHILGTLDRPTSGSLEFSGKDVAMMTSAQLASFRNRSIGFVFQFHHLLPEFNAVENVMMPCLVSRVPRAKAAKQAQEMLDRLGLGARLGHRPGELSGGEQQRVALARALVMRPKLLLADEPTGNLDTATSGQMHDLFLELNEQLGTTMMIVTHNLELAGRLPRCLRMVDGQLLEDREAAA